MEVITIINNVKRAIALLTLFFNMNNVKAQINLVNNSSFEIYPACTGNVYATFWYPAGKVQGNYTNSCYTSSCGGVPITCCSGNYNYQYPRSGNAYVVNFFIGNTIGLNRRHYHQTKLRDSLKHNKNYYVEFYVNNCVGSNYASNNICALLTKMAVFVDTIATPFGVLPANPQIFNYGNPVIYDTLNWVKVSSIYKAQGGEEYLTLGNFRYDNQTNYTNISSNQFNSATYNIDDVSVYELDNSNCLYAGRDTTIKPNDSVFIGSYTNGIDTIKWYNSNGQVIDSVQPGFWVKPNATGNYRYIVEQTVNGCYSKDTVYVNVILPLRMLSLTLNPSPTERDFIVANWTTANEVNVSHHNILKSINAKDWTTIGTVKALNNSYNEYSFIDELKPNTQYPTPLYYRIESIDKDGKKSYSAIRNIKLEIRNGISVYPNPAKEFVNIVGNNIKEVKLLNTVGQVLKQQSFNTPVNSLLWRVGEAKGLYIVQVITKNGEAKNEKLVIE